MEAMEKRVDEPDRTGVPSIYSSHDWTTTGGWGKAFPSPNDWVVFPRADFGREPWLYYAAVAAVLVFVVALPIFWR